MGLKQSIEEPPKSEKNTDLKLAAVKLSNDFSFFINYQQSPFQTRNWTAINCKGELISAGGDGAMGILILKPGKPPSVKFEEIGRYRLY